MEQRTVYVSDDGFQFQTAEECQRYELLSAAVGELQAAKDRSELPDELASDPIAVDAFLGVLGDFRRPLPGLAHRVVRPEDLESAVRILIALADRFRAL